MQGRGPHETIECPQDDTLVAFADGEVDDAVRRDAVGAHLEQCDACRGAVARLVRSASSADRAPVDPTCLRPGDRLGRYVVESLLGSGGMGIVYAARDPELERSVAIKLLRPELVTTGAHARLASEARVMARLSHVNVLAVHDVGSDRAGAFIVMERVNGKNLRRWCADQRRTPQEMLAVFAAAGEGLAAAHRAGIVHGDFKPDNVLIDGDRVRVGDFGLARSVSGASTVPRDAIASTDEALDTFSGRLGGTPAYMAPEQLRGGEATPRSDQFAFASALYECAYGTRPFAGGTVKERLAAIDAGTLAPRLPEHAPPRWLARVVGRALAVDPGRRYPTVEALVAELRRAPRRRARNVSIVAGLALVATCATALVATRDGATCTAPVTAFDGIWDDGVRARIGASFAATEAPYAGDGLRTATAHLDAHVARWLTVHREVCEEARARGDEADATMAARTACLEDRRAEVAAVTSRLTAADRRTAEHVVEAVTRLRSVEPCKVTERLAGLHDPASGLARFGEILRRGEAAQRLGSFDEADASAAEALALLGERPPPEALAEVRLLSGSVAGGRGDFKAAVEHLDEALVAASAVGDPHLLARVWLDLADAQVGRNKNEDAERSVRQAEAALARFADERLRSARFRIRGAVLNALARHDEAASILEEGYRHAERELGASSVEATRIASELARALGRVPERDADARRWFEHALSTGAGLKGAEHPSVATTHNNYGNYLRRLRRFDQAVEHLEAALRIRAATLGEAHPHYVSTLINLATVRSDQRRFAESIRLCERAVELVARSPEPDHYRSAAALLTWGEAEIGSGAPGAAVPILVRAIEHRKLAVGSPHPHVGYDYWAKGRAELALSRFDAARESLDLAKEQFGKAGPAGAEAEAARFRFDRARAAFALPTARAAALAEAREAAKALRALADDDAARDVTAWLSLHDPTHARAPR